MVIINDAIHNMAKQSIVDNSNFFQFLKNNEIIEKTGVSHGHICQFFGKFQFGMCGKIFFLLPHVISIVYECLFRLGYIYKEGGVILAAYEEGVS